MAHLFHRATLFCDEHPQLVDAVTEITMRSDVVAKIYDNVPLFEKIYRSGCTIIDDIGIALSMYKGARNSVLIHFAGLGLYGIFTCEQYLEFIRNFDTANILAINMLQVVPAESAQKFVFMCTDAGCFESLKKYAQDCFHANVSTSVDEIIVAVNVNSNADILEHIDMLHVYVRNRGDVKCSHAIRYIPSLRVHDHRYREYFCNDMFTARTVDELIARSKNVVAVSSVMW